MTNPLQSLIDAPLANATKINLPAGKRPAPRSRKAECDDSIGPKASAAELKQRRQKATDGKLGALFDYYAATDLPADRVAEHMGLYRQDQTGVDDKGKPTFSRVLDVERAEQQLAWRRKVA